MRLSLSTVAVTVAFVTTALAGPFDGVWNAETCSSDSDMTLLINGDSLGFYASACRLSNPVPVRDMPGATLYDMTCSGEGDTWKSRILLAQGMNDTLIRVEEGIAVTYQRCR